MENAHKVKLLFCKDYQAMARLVLSVDCCFTVIERIAQPNLSEPQMKLRTALATVVTGCGLALAGGAAMAVPCDTITTIGQWELAPGGSCEQGDKVWTIGANNLNDNVQVLFISPIENIHVMQMVGFDTSDAAGSWSIDYTISVTDPNFFIDAMFAGADNPGGLGSLLTKDVTGDEVFSLSVVNGAENAGSGMVGLEATTLNVSEDFSVIAGAQLLSVSNTYRQAERIVPEPGSLALIGLALAGLAVVRRRR